MKLILVSTLFTTLVAYANGMNINFGDINISSINNQIFSIKNPNVRAAINVSYGNFDDDINEKLNPSLSNLTEEEKKCVNELQEYNDCANPTVLNENVCRDLLEGKCKEFYADPLSKIPSCKIESINGNELEFMIHLYKYMGNMVQLACIDNGNCPIMKDINQYTVENRRNNMRKSQTEDIGYIPDEITIKENCKSAECSDKAIHVFEELININESSKVVLNEVLEETKGLEGTISEEVIQESIKSADNQNAELTKSIESLKSCKSTSDGHIIRKTLSNLCIDSLLIATFFFMYMRN